MRTGYHHLGVTRLLLGRKMSLKLALVQFVVEAMLRVGRALRTRSRVGSLTRPSRPVG